MIRWLADDLGIPKPSPAELLRYLLASIGLVVVGWVVVVLVTL